MVRKFRVDFSTQTGTKIGDGPLRTATGASVTRALDGAGNVSLTAQGTDERAVALMTNENRVTLYLDEDLKSPRLLGRGVLRTINASGSSTNWSLTASGPDQLDELKRYTTLLRRAYKGVAASTIFEDLADIAGWDIIIAPAISSNLLTARFDGGSVLKALQMLVENYGYHLRGTENTREIEVGLFGDLTTLVAINARQVAPNIDDNPDVVLIDNISIRRDTESLVNWIMPVGGGGGVATLTLENSTRTSPYPIQSLTGPDGSTQYYLENTSSIAQYGVVQKTGAFKDITPLDNTDAGIELAANALYDASAAYLERSSQRLDTYKVTLRKLDRSLQPGDKIRIIYRGLVYDENGVPVDFLNVDTEVWVLKVSESISPSDLTVRLTVATVDRYEYNTAKIIVGALEAIRLNNLSMQPYPSTFIYPFTRQMDLTHTGNIPLVLSDGILYIDRVTMRFLSRSFRSNVAGVGSAESTVGSTSTAESSLGTSGGGGSATPTTSSGGSSTPTSAGGGDHRHVMFRPETDVAPAGVQGYVCASDSGGIGSYHVAFRGSGFALWTNDGSGDHTHLITIPNHSHTVTLADHTHSVTVPSHFHDVTLPSHTHDQVYGIYDDTATPDTISIAVNGTDRTSALGGPWAVGGGEVDITVDITEYILTAVGGIRQRHTITFSCNSSQGEVEATIEVKATVQSLQQVG